MPKRVPDPLTEEEATAILDAAMVSDRDYLILRLIARIGLRPGQIYGIYKRECGGWMYGIQKRDIDFRKKKIRVYFLRQKKYVRKEVPADDTAIDNTTIVKLAEYTAKMDPDDYVFNSISYRQFLRLPKINAKRARIAKEISFHSFRDIYVRQLCNKGLSPFQIKDLAGLADLEGIMRYANPPTAAGLR